MKVLVKSFFSIRLGRLAMANKKADGFPSAFIANLLFI